MKLSIVLFSVLVAQISMANCLGEAQIIAKVASIKSKSLTSCSVNIDANTIVQYNVNQTCPLDIQEVLYKGVEVGLNNGHDCALDSGDDISGVIFLNEAGTINLE
jgi:hypothetical protein